jgi:hypothetical protein
MAHAPSDVNKEKFNLNIAAGFKWWNNRPLNHQVSRLDILYTAKQSE